MLKKIFIAAGLALFFCNPVLAQENGQWGITAFTNYSLPVAGLSEWFKPAVNFGIGAGQQIRNDWFVEGLLEYTKYDQENTSGYAKEHVDLQLEHTGILINGKYLLTRFSNFKTSFNLGGGLYYWKGIRGEIEPNPDLNPALPYIEQKTLEEWNWGVRSGISLEYWFTRTFAIEANGYYRLIIGDLWPTLQPHIELEGVSGFQSVNISLFLRYFF